MEIGEVKSVTIRIVRTKRGIFVNFGDNHRPDIGPLDYEPTFLEAVTILQAREDLLEG